MCKLSIQSFRPSDGGNQGKNPDGAMARHPRSVWWISHPAHPWFLLQLRQHDDLPDILHEVIVLSLTNLYTSLDCCRQHGSPDLTYADFIVVQSVWGMTQGLIMPLSGYISRCPPPSSDIRQHTRVFMFSRLTGPRAAMLLGCLIFSLGAAVTR